MNIVFMGTPDFAVYALKALARHPSCNLQAIITRPDAVSKRGKALVPSPVRAAAEELGLASIVHTAAGFYLRDEQGALLRSEQGERLLDEALLATIRQADPDFIVVAAYGALLPSTVIALPRIDCINIHASLLPRWRGAAPIQRAILAGDEQLGVSLMRMEEGLDTGPYCATASVSAAGKNATELTLELAEQGANLLVKTLPLIAQGAAQWVEQDESKVTYADKIAKHELALLSADPTALNLRRVRASSPQAPARCVLAGRSVTVLSARILSESSDQPYAKRLLFPCSDGDLEVLELKPDGKRAMSSQAFLAGL